MRRILLFNKDAGLRFSREFYKLEHLRITVSVYEAFHTQNGNYGNYLWELYLTVILLMIIT